MRTTQIIRGSPSSTSAKIIRKRTRTGPLVDIDNELTTNSEETDSTVTEMFFFIARVAAGTTAATRPRSFNEEVCEPDANDVVAAFVVVVVVDLCVIAVVVVVVFVLVVVAAVTDFFETDDILSQSIFVA